MIPNIVVIDFETLSTEHNAALISIGAVELNINTGSLGEQFYANITPESSIAAGLDVSESTKAWWLKQGKAAQDVLSVNQRDLRSVLTEFTIWCNQNNIKYAIGNGPRADNQWLESACKALGMASPIKYWGDLDMRTLTFIGTYILGMKHWHSTFKGVKHNALHDAINEAEFCRDVFKKLIERNNTKMAEFKLIIDAGNLSELGEIIAKLTGSTPGHTITVAHPNPVTATPTPPGDDTEETNANPPSVDKNGLKWDERIHASTKTTNADGTWKKKRGVDDALVASVTAELTAGATPTPGATVTPTPTPTPGAVVTPTPTPGATVTPNADRIKDFQSIVQDLMTNGTAIHPAYQSTYHGAVTQALLKKAGVTNIPAATDEQMQKLYSVRDQLIANMVSICGDVPIDTLIP